MKRFFLVIFTVVAVFFITACSNKNQGGNDSGKQVLNVFNWGEYIGFDPVTINGVTYDNVIDAFEKIYNVKVNYETFDSNEAMYTKLIAGDARYDVIIPSDYMIERLIKQDRLNKIDFSLIPNYSLISQDIVNKLDEEYPDIEMNDYVVPYFYGTVGILYDKTKVTKTVDSWSILWDEDYKKKIFMYDSQRDSLMVALKLLGYSMNTHDLDELQQAKEKLIEQKPLVYAYVGDSVIQQMIDGEAYLAVVYSGDAAYIMDNNPNMSFAIPKEGTNFWIDSMVIPKTSQNVELAHKFINFMISPEIARANTEYVMYTTPVEQVFNEVIEEDWANNYAYNPTIIDVFGGNIQTEVFRDPGDFIKEYDKIWSEVLSPERNYIVPIVIGGVVIIGLVAYLVLKKRKNRVY